MCVQPVQTFLCPRTLRLWEERYLYNETCLKCSDNTLSLSFPKAVREEQKALPWPFIRSTAVPQSPPLAASSPYSRSLSVGSSPNRTPRPQPHIPPHLADNYRTKRTRYAPSRAAPVHLWPFQTGTACEFIAVCGLITVFGDAYLQAGYEFIQAKKHPKTTSITECCGTVWVFVASKAR